MINVGYRKQKKVAKEKIQAYCYGVWKLIGIIVIVLTLFNVVFSIYWKDKTRLYYLDVGQGDACVITHNQQTFLVDGGGNRYMDDANNIGRRVVYPFLLDKKIDNIDVAFISHMHYDHVKGILELLEYVNIEKVAISHVYKTIIEDQDRLQESPLIEELINGCYENGSELLFLEAGDIIVGENIRVECHYPYAKTPYQENENNNSMILELVTHQRRILFTGDIEEDVERLIVNEGLNNTSIDLLKVAHHGSKTSSSRMFLEMLKPSVGIISVGKNNHGHPSQEVLKRYEEFKIPVYLTKDYGMIEVIIDKKELKIKTYLIKD
jgi:competence protein ComEC